MSVCCFLILEPRETENLFLILILILCSQGLTSNSYVIYSKVFKKMMICNLYLLNKWIFPERHTQSYFCTIAFNVLSSDINYKLAKHYFIFYFLIQCFLQKALILTKPRAALQTPSKLPCLNSLT